MLRRRFSARSLLLASTALVASTNPAAAGDTVMLRWQMGLGSPEAATGSLALEYRPASAGILTLTGQESAAGLAAATDQGRPVARIELTPLIEQDDDRAYFAEADSTGEWMKKNWPWVAGGVGVAGLATWAIASAGGDDDDDDDDSDDGDTCSGTC